MVSPHFPAGETGRAQTVRLSGRCADPDCDGCGETVHVEGWVELGRLCLPEGQPAVCPVCGRPIEEWRVEI